MALTSTTIQQPVAPVKEPVATTNNAAAPILAALMLSVFAAQKSKKELRKLKSRAMAAVLKFKLKASFSRLKSMFSKKRIEGISDTTLLYILLGLLVLVLIFTLPPLVAVVVLLVGILLILLTRK